MTKYNQVPCVLCGWPEGTDSKSKTLPPILIDLHDPLMFGGWTMDGEKIEYHKYRPELDGVTFDD